MQDLLLNHNLSKSKPVNEIRQVAKEQTLTTLRRLDDDRNRIVLRFLQDAHLIGMQDAVIDLSNSDLSNDYLHGADLSGIDLAGAILTGTDLSGSNLSGADLYGADLQHANLSDANLSNAFLIQDAVRAGYGSPGAGFRPLCLVNGFPGGGAARCARGGTGSDRAGVASFRVAGTGSLVRRVPAGRIAAASRSGMPPSRAGSG
jgi:uncharacterized protein YjbI with pentapeptide repeats